MDNCTKSDLDGIKALHERGAHLIRVSPSKRPAEPPGWVDNPPDLAALLEHVDRGGRVGINPQSVGLALMDVDHGPPDAIAHYFRPFAFCRSGRPERAHLYYRSAHAVGQQRWRYGRCSGELRGRPGGYAVVWDSAPLLEALVSPGGVDFEDVLPELDLSRPPKPHTAAVQGVSCRSVLMDALIAARRAGLTGDDLWAAAWYAFTALDHPGHLAFAEVRPLVSWAAARSWDTESQREKALIGGAHRRARNAARDARIAAMLLTGGSLRSTAAAFGLSVGAIQKVKTRLLGEQERGRLGIHPPTDGLNQPNPLTPRSESRRG